MTIRTVHIEFTSPKGKLFPFFSWAIRAFECTKYSHVRIKWVNSVGKTLIYEASGSHVKLIGTYAAEQNPVHVHYTHSFDLTNEQYRKLIGLFDYANVDYGVWQIFGIAFARMFGLKKNPFSSGKSSMVCSELVALFLNDVLGMDIPQEEFDLIGPRGIKKLLDSRIDV